jgi:hypothetical protein
MTADISPPATSIRQHAYSVASFSLAFSIGRSMIYEEIRAGRLAIRKVGARTLIGHDDAVAWFEALPTRSAEAPRTDPNL